MFKEQSVLLDFVALMLSGIAIRIYTSGVTTSAFILAFIALVLLGASVRKITAWTVGTYISTRIFTAMVVMFTIHNVMFPDADRSSILFLSIVTITIVDGFLTYSEFLINFNKHE